MTIKGRMRGSGAGLLLLLTGWPGVVPAAAPADLALSRTDQAAVFKAAGAVERKGRWILCADDPNSSGAKIETVRDLNGDGRPEALVSDDGTQCYGFTGAAFTLLSRQADGSWRVMSRQTGMAEFLKSSGVGGWPDIAVGGPGFCFPVLRWNGKEYRQQRFEYEGKSCQPPR